MVKAFFPTFRLEKFLLLFFIVVTVFAVIPLFLSSLRRNGATNSHYSYLRILEWATYESDKTRVFVVDEECIRQLQAKTTCKTPVSVAVFGGMELLDVNATTSPSFLRLNASLFQIAWLVEDRSERDFWLFRDTENASNSIALKRFSTERAWISKNQTQLQIEIPSNLAQFRQSWQNGRFFECQIVLRRNETGLKRNLPLSMLDRLAELIAHMQLFNVTAFLCGGTLLGWRRECSIIPHTHDLDLFIFSEQHSLPLIESFIHSKKFLLYWILGQPFQGLELTVLVDGFKIDIFYLYQNATRNQSFITGMLFGERQRLYWFYPKIEELCAAELDGHLFHIPCNFDGVLEADYGKDGWKVDFPTSKYVYYESGKNVEPGERFSPAEWNRQVIGYHSNNANNKEMPKWD